VTPAVAASVAGGVLPYPSNGHSTNRRAQGRVIAVVGAGLVLLVVGAVMVGFLFVRDLGKALGQAFSGLSQFAAGDAAYATEVASNHHIPDGALTPTFLNQEGHGLEWVSRNASKTDSGGNQYVSISAADAHVVTAENIGSCQYGLSVTSATDPVVAADHLAGVGTYWNWNTPEPVSGCTADSAPTTGWQRADPVVVRRMIAAHS
jgi:hypothetical protein